MKKIALILTSLFFTGFCNIYSQQQTISDDDNYYSINIPSGWVHAYSKNKIISVLMCSDTVNTNERLSINATKNYYNLAKTYKTNKDAFKDFKNFKLIQEGDGTIGGQPSKWFVYTFDASDGQKMQGKQITSIKSGKTYIIQYVVTQKRHDAIRDTFDNMIASLKFNK